MVDDDDNDDDNMDDDGDDHDGEMTNVWTSMVHLHHKINTYHLQHSNKNLLPPSDLLLLFLFFNDHLVYSSNIFVNGNCNGNNRSVGRKRI